MSRRSRRSRRAFVASVGTRAKSALGRYLELWYSLAAILAITGVYLLAYRQAGTYPKASGLVGHGIGVLGFVLMLMTATLYSVRKRLTDARWGSMAAWLRFHMVTGLVGPYMVLLHTAMRFHGLAGIAMLLTVIVVISGVIGRYIYTAVPRVLADAAPSAGAPDRPFARSEAPAMPSGDLAMASSGPAIGSAVSLDPSPIGSGRSAGMRTAAGGRSHDKRLDRLEAERGALAIWRSFHVPLTWALFVTALVHAAGALYYSLGR